MINIDPSKFNVRVMISGVALSVAVWALCMGLVLVAGHLDGRSYRVTFPGSFSMLFVGLYCTFAVALGFRFKNRWTVLGFVAGAVALITMLSLWANA
jgi:hypothetical protein